MRWGVSLAALLVCAASLAFIGIHDTPAQAQAYQCRMPAAVSVPTISRDAAPRSVPVTGYTLALSWSPEFCKGREMQSGQRTQCSGRNGRFGFIVHGLWPDGRSTWPQWCANPRKVTPAEARRNMCMMPSTRLIARQWAKHGSCMTRTPATYFKVTRILWDSLRMPGMDSLSRSENLTAGDFREAFVAANPDWPRSAIGLDLNRRGWLEEVRLCYGKDFMPKRCERRRYGPADAASMKIWRGM